MQTLLVSPAEWETLTALRLLGKEATPEQIVARAGKPESTVRNALNELRIKKAVKARRTMERRINPRLRWVRAVYYSLAPGVRVMVSFERVRAAESPQPRKKQGRVLRLGIPVNADEFESVKSAALAHKMSVSEYVRLRLYSEEGENAD